MAHMPGGTMCLVSSTKRPSYSLPTLDRRWISAALLHIDRLPVRQQRAGRSMLSIQHAGLDALMSKPRKTLPGQKPY